jgi:membrane protease YdiL (CAAX protease family)
MAAKQSRYNFRTIMGTLDELFWRRIIFLAAVWAASYGGTYLVLRYLGIAEQAYSSLIINTVFLVTCIGCIRVIGLSAQDLGLKIIRQKLASHVRLCLAIFTLYSLYYLFVVRISGLRPLTSATVWRFFNYLVVTLAEEIYFRGIIYHLVEERTSGRVAILISGLLFGFVHFRQGLGMLPKFFTGWLWGSVRCATGMILMLIFPVHLTYNAVWLLFQGNWDNLPTWAYLFPLVELLFAILIVVRFKSANHFTEISKSSAELLLNKEV